MKIFLMKDVKKAFFAIIVILICGIATGQVMVGVMENHFKQAMIAHDSKIAGYFARKHAYRNASNGSWATSAKKAAPSTANANASIASAFTAPKTAADLARGEELLKTAGYHGGTTSVLLPEINGFHQKFALSVFVWTFALSVGLITAFLYYTVGQDRKLEKAAGDILKLMDGNYDMRIRSNENEEGSLAKLYSSIHTISTSLTAHIVKEKQNKEFLRDTISDISHQLKTPLAALKMYNEIMRSEEIGNEVVYQFLIRSEHELERMENQIQSLLKLARLDAGAIELEKRSVNLQNLLEDCLEGFRTRAELERKSFTLGCDGGLKFDCDKQWMSEAIANIIKNALDHSAANGRVDIVCDETPVVTRIMIRDNGSGIHPEDIHHIFKRFYRSRFSQDKQGVGIGLTLSKSIVEKHDGSILVESELGKGTAFHLVFPRVGTHELTKV